MNLAQQAEADLSFTLEDVDNGFGVALTLTDDSSVDYAISVQTTDIGFFMDPETGIGVAGRTVEVVVRISTLAGLGGGYPSKDWTGQYTDTNGSTWAFAVQKNEPDRKLGVYKLTLEGFTSGA